MEVVQNHRWLGNTGLDEDTEGQRGYETWSRNYSNWQQYPFLPSRFTMISRLLPGKMRITGLQVQSSLLAVLRPGATFPGQRLLLEIADRKELSRQSTK